jgi:nitrate/TMAO reductase-like tetraheme cytochrome c subunit
VATPIRLPTALRNPASLIGIVITTVMAMLFLGFALLDLLGYLTNPYLGLILFVALPAGFIAGLILIPLGAWRTARRRRQDPTVGEWPVIDLRIPRHRAILLTVVALTLVNILIVSIGAYGGVHYMESAEFCGTTCHVTMEPQWAAYQIAPHARILCVDCHVGPGTGALVESKFEGTRQLFQVVTGNVPKPVPSPRTMRPARDTCERCHWSEKFHGDRVKTVREYADDEANTETATNVVLHVGGGSSTLGVGTGIHWHMNIDNRIEFITTDKKEETIAYVKLTDRNGNAKEYVAEGVTKEQIAAGTLKRMDCMDCHNRPAHTFDATAERAIDKRMAQGLFPRELPFVRREAVTAIKEEYASRDQAFAAIATRLQEFYRSHTPSRDSRLVGRAVMATQDAWARNVFPRMRVTWSTYPNNIGHLDFPGCFRCHDDSKKAKDGSVIRQDCELCHSMPD